LNAALAVIAVLETWFCASVVAGRLRKMAGSWFEIAAPVRACQPGSDPLPMPTGSPSLGSR